MCNRLLMISIGQLIRMSLMTSLLWRRTTLLVLTEFPSVSRGFCWWLWFEVSSFGHNQAVVEGSSFFDYIAERRTVFIRKTPDIDNLGRIIRSLDAFVHWHCRATVIANSLLLSHFEALLVHHEMYWPPRRDASPPGKWRTTSSRLIALSSPMSRVLRKNQVFFGLTFTAV